MSVPGKGLVRPRDRRSPAAGETGWNCRRSILPLEFRPLWVKTVTGWVCVQVSPTRRRGRRSVVLVFGPSALKSP